MLSGVHSGMKPSSQRFHGIGNTFLRTLLGVHAPGDTFAGNFIYRNKSGVALTAVNTTGFDLPWAGPGNFGVGGEAVEVRGKQPYPKTCTITWQEELVGKNSKSPPRPKGPATPPKKYSQTLPLHTIPPERRKGTLIFEFTRQKRWTFYFSPETL